MCLAQGPQCSDAGEALTAVPRSRVKHSTTEPLRSLWIGQYGCLKEAFAYEVST